WSLSSLINLFDYHQRVPTQIDRSKLLKSLLSRLASQVDGHSSVLNQSVKHFFEFIFEEKLNSNGSAKLPTKSLRSVVAVAVSVGRIIEMLITLASVFSKEFRVFVPYVHLLARRAFF
ncbi:hypothetical protein AB4302_15685, partial [Vibrio breoganii]